MKCECVDGGHNDGHGQCLCGGDLATDLAIWQQNFETQARVNQRLEEALQRLAEPKFTARTEEGALIQLEVQQIARDALRGGP
jgi:hypothetical protein